MNATNGAQLWNYRFFLSNGAAAAGSLSEISSSPTVVNGKVYFGVSDGNIYALNAANSDKLWNYTTDNLVESSPAVVNDVVYIGSGDDNVYALNATNGDKLWNCTTSNSVSSTPDVVNGIVYVGSMMATFML